MITWLKQARVQAGLVVAFAWIVYGNALPGDFNFDDFHHVRDNLALQINVSLPRFFTDPQTFSARAGVKMFRPLTMLSYAAGYQALGGEAIAFHFVNLVLHSLNALLVFGLARRRLEDKTLALLLALAFAAATVNSMAVNYISSRSDLLAAGFCLLTLYLDPGPAPEPLPRRTLRLAGALLASALGLLCKESVIILPGLILARDLTLFPGVRLWFSRRALIYLAYAVVAAGYLGLRYRMMDTLVGAAGRPFFQNLFNQAKAVILYLAKIFFPFHLSILPDLSLSKSPLDPIVLAAILGVLALLALIALAVRRFPLAALGLSWFILSLLPTSLIPLNVTFSEPRVYFGSIGILLAGGSLFSRAFSTARPGLRYSALTLLMLLILIQAGLTRQRNSLWQNGYRLWSEATSLSPTRPLTMTYMGVLAQERKQSDQAQWLLEKAWRSAPDDPAALFSLGWFYLETGQGEEARPLLEKYLALVEIPGEKARALIELIQLDLYDQRLPEAKARLEQVLALTPEDPEAWFWSGQAAELEKELETSEADYRRAIAASPRFPEAEGRLGAVLAQQGKLDEAETFLEQAVAHGSQDPRVYLHLGNLYGIAGRLEEAKDMIDRALELKPDYAVAHLNRGVIHLQRKEFPAAEKELKETLRLDPSLANAHNQLVLVYLAMVEEGNLGLMSQAQVLALVREHLDWMAEHGFSNSELEAKWKTLQVKKR